MLLNRFIHGVKHARSCSTDTYINWKVFNLKKDMECGMADLTRQLVSVEKRVEYKISDTKKEMQAKALLYKVGFLAMTGLNAGITLAHVWLTKDGPPPVSV